MSILPYECTTRTLIKLNGNCTRMLLVILNKSWQLHFTKQQLYGHLYPMSKTIQIIQTKYAEHSWRIKDELISNVFNVLYNYGMIFYINPFSLIIFIIRFIIIFSLIIFYRSVYHYIFVNYILSFGLSLYFR